MASTLAPRLSMLLRLGRLASRDCEPPVTEDDLEVIFESFDCDLDDRDERNDDAATDMSSGVSVIP